MLYFSLLGKNILSFPCFHVQNERNNKNIIIFPCLMLKCLAFRVSICFQVEMLLIFVTDLLILNTYSCKCVSKVLFVVKAKSALYRYILHVQHTVL